MRLKVFTFLTGLFLPVLLPAQEVPDFLTTANNLLDDEQKRIDGYDGEVDFRITLSSNLQTEKATAVYMDAVNRIQANINRAAMRDLDKKQLLFELRTILEKVNRTNYHLYSTYETYFDLIVKVQEVADNERVSNILRANVITAIRIIPFYVDRPYASELLLYAASQVPSELLREYNNFRNRLYTTDVLEELARQAPLHVRFYMGQSNPISRDIKNTSGKPVITLIKELHSIYGSNSKIYLLIDDIQHKRLSLKEAEELVKDDDKLYNHLVKLRVRREIWGNYSVDDELTYMSLKKIRVINDLHEASDAVRFASVNQASAEELYSMMVYGDAEVYTSTFLGLYKKLTARMSGASTYEFLHSMGMNKFRTFIRQCANYNTLPEWMKGMEDWEKNALFRDFIGGLEKSDNHLEAAVAVADTYGSLKDEENKKLFESTLRKKYEEVRYTSAEGGRIYSLLLALFHLDLNGDGYATDLQVTPTVPSSELFKADVNMQQHFFFDDDDGHASYASFLAKFNHPNWKIEDKGNYVKISSVRGKKVEIYANKSTAEYAGQDDIKAYFDKIGRYPDIVIHRGHSYYVSVAIESLTPNAEVVVLGSCGGFNNISKVLDYSPDAHIISSKQVGTMHVNDDMIFLLNEWIRQGKDLEWEVFWTQLESRMKNKGNGVMEKFYDYIPPHKNLGAILIKNYRAML